MSARIPEFVLAPPHVLEEPRTGWLAEPDDAVSFARAIAAALATEAASYNAIGTRARRLAESVFHAGAHRRLRRSTSTHGLFEGRRL